MSKNKRKKKREPANSAYSTAHTFGEMMLSTLLSRLHSNTWALVSFLSQWAASQILASGPLLLRTKCA